MSRPRKLSQTLSQSNSKRKQNNTNVRHLLNNLCSVAGEISDICKVKTSQGELLNQQELSNLKVAAEILRSTRESQLKAKLLKNQEEFNNQQPPLQLDSKTILDLLKTLKDKDVVDVKPI